MKVQSATGSREVPGSLISSTRSDRTLKITMFAIHRKVCNVENMERIDRILLALGNLENFLMLGKMMYKFLLFGLIPEEGFMIV